MALRLSVRAPVCRPAAVRPSRAVPTSRAPVVHRFLVVPRSGSADVEAKVTDAIKEAEEACAKGTTADCAVAWDNVEELSAAASHKKVAEGEPEQSDPLEKFCVDNPEADECRVYED